MEGRVLVVDPDVELRNHIQEILDNLGFTVYTAGSFDEAHSYISFYKIDHLIMDLILPDKNGIDLLVFVKQASPNTKVYVYTDVRGATIERSVLKKGADAFINKTGDFKKDFENIFFKPLGSGVQVSQTVSEVEGFKGVLAGVDIIDMVQALGLMGKTVQLICKDTKTLKEGVIYFKNGEIIAAKTGNKEGEEALYEILGWKNGVFETRLYSEEPERTINAPIDLLLLNFAKIKDEAEEQRAAERLTLQDIVKLFHAEIPGFIGAMIFDYEEGTPIAFDTVLIGRTFQASATLYGAILKSAQEAMEIVTEGKEKREELSEMIITDKNDHVLLFPIPVNNFAIFVLVSRDTPIQEVRAVILKYIPDVIKLLKEERLS